MREEKKKKKVTEELAVTRLRDFLGNDRTIHPVVVPVTFPSRNRIRKSHTNSKHILGQVHD